MGVAGGVEQAVSAGGGLVCDDWLDEGGRKIGAAECCPVFDSGFVAGGGVFGVAERRKAAVVFCSFESGLEGSRGTGTLAVATEGGTAELAVGASVSELSSVGCSASTLSLYSSGTC